MNVHFVTNIFILYRAKHPVKVHVWAGISWLGATDVCIFEGIMDAPLFVDILGRTLLPFLRERFPDTHRFMQVGELKLWWTFRIMAVPKVSYTVDV